MTNKKQILHFLCAFTFASILGCGMEPEAYENEKIIFENIGKSDHMTAKTEGGTRDELSLKEQERSEFLSPLFGPAYTYGLGYGSYGYPLNPLLDYYRWPVAIEAVTPFDSYVVDWVHPFYLPLYLDNLADADDDAFLDEDDDAFNEDDGW